MKSRPLICSLVAVAVVIILTGSSTFGASSKNTSRARFLNEVWVSPELQGKALSDVYSRVYFAPVTVEQLKKQSWWASQNVRTKSLLESDAHKLAQRMHASLVNAAHNYPKQRMQVVGQPGPDTLIIEVAITELVPAKAFWNAAATAAGFVVPGAGFASMAGKGAIGFEGRLRDGKTGAVIADFRHRSTDKSAIVNVASYQWYRGSEKSIDEFAVKSAKVLHTPAGTVVNRSAPIKLMAF